MEGNCIQLHHVQSLDECASGPYNLSSRQDESLLEVLGCLAIMTKLHILPDTVMQNADVHAQNMAALDVWIWHVMKSCCNEETWLGQMRYIQWVDDNPVNIYTVGPTLAQHRPNIITFTM